MSSVVTSPHPAGTPGHAHPVLDVAVPVYNEVAELEHSVRTLRRYLDEQLPFPARITIADNASTDGTWVVASRLAAQLSGVRAVHLDQKGRGRALRAVWSQSDADVVAYMDVDLATDLDALLPLVAPLVSGHSDVAIGSRLAPGARVLRGAKRELISRSYNQLLRVVLHTGFTDAQCGFKALRADVARALLPLVDDQAWFFDTELLAVAEHSGLRIHEVPVDWTDDPDSRVDVASTAVADLRGTWRLARRFARHHRTDVGGVTRSGAGRTTLARFAGIGSLSTVAYVGLFLGLRPGLGPFAANAVALSACAVANAAAHRLVGGHGLAGVGGTGAGGTGAGGTRVGEAPDETVATSAGLLAAGLALSTLALAAVRGVTGSVPLAVAALLVSGAVISLARVVLRRNSAYRAHLNERN